MCMQKSIVDFAKSIVDAGYLLSDAQTEHLKGVLVQAGELSAAAGECPCVSECACAVEAGLENFYSDLTGLGISAREISAHA